MAACQQRHPHSCQVRPDRGLVPTPAESMNKVTTCYRLHLRRTCRSIRGAATTATTACRQGRIQGVYRLRDMPCNYVQKWQHAALVVVYVCIQPCNCLPCSTRTCTQDLCPLCTPSSDLGSTHPRCVVQCRLCAAVLTVYVVCMSRTCRAPGAEADQTAGAVCHEHCRTGRQGEALQRTTQGACRCYHTQHALPQHHMHMIAQTAAAVQPLRTASAANIVVVGCHAA
jgi:hypothetical protein